MPELANFDPAAVAALAPEARATFEASLERAGFSKEVIAAKFAPASAGSTSEEHSPVVTENVNWLKHPTLSDKQQQALADNLAKHWTGDPEVLRQALEANGFVEVDEANDLRTEAERTFDATLGGVAPAEYDLNGLYVGRGNVPIENVAALDSELRGALTAMAVPKALGRGIAEALIDSADAYAGIPEGPARQIWAQEQKVMLARIGGAEVNHMTRLAAHALSRVNEDTRAMLHEAGALESHAVVLQLARQGERLLAREAMASRRGE